MKQTHEYKVTYSGGQTIIIHAHSSTQARHEAKRVTGQRTISATRIEKPVELKKTSQLTAEELIKRIELTLSTCDDNEDKVCNAKELIIEWRHS